MNRSNRSLQSVPIVLLGGLAFRFLTAYLLLYTVHIPLGFVPWTLGGVGKAIRSAWESAVLFVGHRIFGIEGEIFLGSSGSGDTTYDYLRLLVIVILATIVTIVWSVIDRRRDGYPRGAVWLATCVSFFLGLALLLYGLQKVVPVQFMVPSLERLLMPYAESTPMGLAWRFLGMSPTYTVFLGLAETIPGFLVLFPRTRLLGACLAVGVMLNVVVINLCFDVPVKLFSLHLLAMAIGLVLYEGRRLVRCFRGCEPAPWPERPPHFRSRRVARIATVMAVALVAVVVWTNLSMYISAYRQWGEGRIRPAIWGVHDVETFTLDGELRPPLTTDDVRWRALVVDRAFSIHLQGRLIPGRIGIQAMDGTIRRPPIELDEAAGTLTVLPRGHATVEDAREAGAEISDVLRYERPALGRLRVHGTFDGHSIDVLLVERDLSELPLLSRGFRWINEFPFNY